MPGGQPTRSPRPCGENSGSQPLKNVNKGNSGSFVSFRKKTAPIVDSADSSSIVELVETNS